MQSVGHRYCAGPSLRSGTHILLATRIVQPKTRHAAHASNSSDTSARSVPQQVNVALQRRQAKLAELVGNLQSPEASQVIVKEVLQEFQGLNEQVQQLAQHIEAMDNKAQAKAAEKALKKARKSDEKALKKERKAAEKEAKTLAKEGKYGENKSMVSTGFNMEPEPDFTAELSNAVVGTVGGDIEFDTSELGSDLLSLGGQHATDIPMTSAAAAPVAVISVCQGSSCQELGSEKLLDYVRETAGTELDVLPCKCLGKCEQGPNLRVRVLEQKPVLHTSLQNGKEVNAILHSTRAQYSRDAMKAFAAAN